MCFTLSQWIILVLGSGVFAVLLFKLWVRHEMKMIREIAERTGAKILEVKGFKPSSSKKEILVNDPKTIAEILRSDRIRKIYVIWKEFVPRYVVETDGYYIHTTTGILKASLKLVHDTVNYAETEEE